MKDTTFLLSASLEMKGQGQITNRWAPPTFDPFPIRGNLYLVVAFSTIASVRKSTISFILGTSSHLCQFTSQVSVLPKVSKVFGMMKGMGTPFLLFSDPRLQGGAFYMGN